MDIQQLYFYPYQNGIVSGEVGVYYIEILILSFSVLYKNLIILIILGKITSIMNTCINISIEIILISTKNHYDRINYSYQDCNSYSNAIANSYDYSCRPTFNDTKFFENSYKDQPYSIDSSFVSQNTSP